MVSGRVTIEALQRRKGRGRKLVMLTAYDVPTARMLDAAGVDIVLVGDSLGMVALGYDGTAAVTMAEMLHHAKAVRRGVTRALLVGDLPREALVKGAGAAVREARRFVADAGCDAVKLEWGEDAEAIARALVAAGIPVMGHVGLTPQTVEGPEGLKVQGREAAAARGIVEAADRLEAAGCWSLVIECVPAPVAGFITRRLVIPTIGIGAGPETDGQVLVTQDLLGLFTTFQPRFVKRYGELAAAAGQAVAAFRADVEAGRFPDAAHSFSMEAEEFATLEASVGHDGIRRDAWRPHRGRLRSAIGRARPPRRVAGTMAARPVEARLTHRGQPRQRQAGDLPRGAGEVASGASQRGSAPAGEWV